MSERPFAVRQSERVKSPESPNRKAPFRARYSYSAAGRGVRRQQRPPGATHLRHRHLDPILRGTDPTRLIAVPRPDLTLDPALVPTPAAQVVALLGLQQLLHH